MKLDIGDLVQIANTATDLITNKSPKPTNEYIEGGDMWGTVSSIVDSFKAQDVGGVIREVTKVAIADANGVVRWQVEPKDIAKNIIKASNPKLLEDINKVVDTVEDVKDFINDPSIGSGLDLAAKLGVDPKILKGIKEVTDIFGLSGGGGSPANLLGDIFGGGSGSTEPYATTPDSDTVDSGGVSSQTVVTGELVDPVENETKPVGSDPFTEVEQVAYTDVSFTPNELGVDMKIHKIQKREIKTAMSDDRKRKIMLNDDLEVIQNQHSFPAQLTPSSELKPARYDYQIDINDDRYPLLKNMEDELMKFRASVGLPVHGNNDIAKAMKYYMYNRFKTPDTNLAHSKSFTYVFFTRPDLNILDFNGGANAQASSNTETSMLWKRNPDIFKLLTDHKRCKDSNNFNLLLSNQCTSFEIPDEQLSTIESGKSWSGHEMFYGDRYTGTTADQFSCTFTETSDYSVISLIKLWVTYIDNVSRGAWYPSYNLQGTGVSTNPTMSHIYSKTLDYAASCYVFKVGPDGENILYWSKYYGIFPVNTGASALSWTLDSSVGEAPKLNINFKYSFKRDMSPVALLEFNKVANIHSGDQATAESSFNPEYGLSSRPYVGAPYVEMKLDDDVKGFPSHNSTSIGPNSPTAVLRLKFRKDPSNAELKDETMYRASLTKRENSSSSQNDPSNPSKTKSILEKAAGSKLGGMVKSAVKNALKPAPKKKFDPGNQGRPNR